MLFPEGKTGGLRGMLAWYLCGGVCEWGMLALHPWGVCEWGMLALYSWGVWEWGMVALYLLGDGNGDATCVLWGDVSGGCCPWWGVGAKEALSDV